MNFQEYLGLSRNAATIDRGFPFTRKLIMLIRSDNGSSNQFKVFIDTG